MPANNVDVDVDDHVDKHHDPSAAFSNSLNKY